MSNNVVLTLDDDIGPIENVNTINRIVLELFRIESTPFSTDISSIYCQFQVIYMNSSDRVPNNEIPFSSSNTKRVDSLSIAYLVFNR